VRIAKSRKVRPAALMEIGAREIDCTNSDARGRAMTKMTSCLACRASSPLMPPRARAAGRFSAARSSSRSDSPLRWRSQFCTFYCSDIYESGSVAITGNKMRPAKLSAERAGARMPISRRRPMPPISPQHAIVCATPTSPADRMLLHPRHTA
jgi:hypothetical protein